MPNNIWISIIVNLIVVAFGYGVLSQEVKRLRKDFDAEIVNRKQNGVQDRQDRKDEAMNEKQDRIASSHQMLPECLSMFRTIAEDIGEIKGILKAK